jgi:hypothetical protein
MQFSHNGMSTDDLKNIISQMYEKNLSKVLKKSKINKDIASEIDIMLVTAKMLDLDISPNVSEVVEKKNTIYKVFSDEEPTPKMSYSIRFHQNSNNSKTSVKTTHRLLSIDFHYVNDKFYEFIAHYNATRSSTKNEDEISSILVSLRQYLNHKQE